MENISTTESDIEKVFRIAKVLGIGIKEAADTCDGFHLAFSDDGMRRAIFDVIDELDRSAAQKGEPLGLIINYTVELGFEGIRVGRYADESPEGEVVGLTPPHRAMIHLRIVDDFPTQEFLGPLMVDRPFSESVPGAVATGVVSENDKVACSDGETAKTAIPLDPSSLESATTVICLGPIRLKFNERFPIVSGRRLKARRKRGSRVGRAGAIPLLSSGPSPVTSNLLPVTCNLLRIASHRGQFGSGLSPPFASENLGLSDRKMS